MELKPFKELIGMTKEKLDAAMAPVRARQVQSQAELKLAEIDEKIITIETQVQELCIEKKINFDKLMDLLDEIALLERRKSQYKKVLKELFPD